MQQFFQDGVLTLEAVAACERVRALRILRHALERLDNEGGVACRGPSSIPWLNLAVGLGLGRPPTPEQVAYLIGWFRHHGVEPRIELADRAHPDCYAILSRAGFRLHLPIAVLAADWALHPPATDLSFPTGIDIRVVDPADEHLTADLARVLTSAFSDSSSVPQPLHLAINTATLRSPGPTAFVALDDGLAVGGGFVDVLDGVAALWGAAVAPSHRRRGIQKALLRHRFDAAFRSGARLAFIEASPGGPTHRNAAGVGFGLAYTRLIFTLPVPPPAVRPLQPSSSE